MRADEFDSRGLRLLRLERRRRPGLRRRRPCARQNPGGQPPPAGLRRRIGMLGALAGAVLARGGGVTGIIPELLVNKEHMLAGAQEIIVTRDMHERKRVMFGQAEAFGAPPA